MYLYQKDKESILLGTKETVYKSKANGRNTTRNRKKTEGIPYRIITSHPLHADSIQNTSAAAEPVAHPPVTVRDAPPPVIELHRFRDIGKNTRYLASPASVCALFLISSAFSATLSATLVPAFRAFSFAASNISSASPPTLCKARSTRSFNRPAFAEDEKR